jgi:uncharacterized protein
MPFFIIAVILLVVLVIYGPSYWVKHVIKRHSLHRSDLSGTGAELARHLLEEASIYDVKVMLTDKGDHYDPTTKIVGLMADNYNGQSISAVAIAAHEVSHAVQHHRSEPSFQRRIALIETVDRFDKAASIILMLAPFVFMFVHSPALFIAQLLLGIALMSVRILVHLITLPVEYDASFTKALPVLERGNYISPADLAAARQVLKAAAMTYVAASLSTLLNLLYWLRVVRI